MRKSTIALLLVGALCALATLEVAEAHKGSGKGGGSSEEVGKGNNGKKGNSPGKGTWEPPKKKNKGELKDMKGKGGKKDKEEEDLPPKKGSKGGKKPAVKQTYNTDNCQTNDATNEHDYNENNNTTNHDATFNTTYDNVNNRIDNAKTINNGDDFYSVATPAALVVQAPTTQSTSDQTSTTTVVYDYGQDFSDLEGYTDLLEESSTTVQPSPTTTPQPTTTAQVDVATTDSDANGKRASPTESTTTEANYLADYGLGAPIFGGESYDAWWLDGNPADAGGGSDAGIVQGGPLNKESVANNKEKEPESERTPSEEVFGDGGGAPYEVKKQETDYGGPPKIKPADDWDEGHRAPQNKEHANDDGSEKKEKDKN
ncbi:hypothetical protein pipiens_010661, partial [Culex pipiens pipiens]